MSAETENYDQLAAAAERVRLTEARKAETRDIQSMVRHRDEMEQRKLVALESIAASLRELEQIRKTQKLICKVLLAQHVHNAKDQLDLQQLWRETFPESPNGTSQTR